MFGKLTKVDKVTKGDYIKRFDEMKSAQNIFGIILNLACRRFKCHKSFRLVYEMRYFHSTRAKGPIEDLVVDSVD